MFIPPYILQESDVHCTVQKQILGYCSTILSKVMSYKMILLIPRDNARVPIRRRARTDPKTSEII